MPPKVSVIIPTFNCGNYISEAIDSVLKQSFKDFEIVIVDDGSTDNTKSVIDKYKERNYPIKYIYQENKGPVYARNMGILKSSGEYIAFLDSDDVWMPDKLKVQMELFEGYNDVYFVYGDICDYDGEKVYQRERINLKPSIRAKLSGRIFVPLFKREIHIPISTAVVKKECFEKVGLFDEKMNKMCSEDREMWLRITNKYKAHYIDEAMAYFRLRSESRSRHIYEMLRGQMYVINKIAKKFRLPLKYKLTALSSCYYETCINCLTINEYRIGFKYFFLALIYSPINIIKPFKILTVIKLLLKQKDRISFLENK